MNGATSVEIVRGNFDNKNRSGDCSFGRFLLVSAGLQVSVDPDCIEAGAVFTGVQVAVTDNQCAGIALVQLFEQLSHGSLLFSRSRVGGLTADVVAALVTYTDAMGIVVHAVGAYHRFRTSWLYGSVTTDDVVVADAVESSVLMPLIYLLCRWRLVGPYRSAMNNN